MRNEAFSFVEVMMAILIVAFGLGPIILFYQQETRVVHFNEYHLLARYRARKILATMGALDYATIKSLVGKASYPLIGADDIASELEALPTLVAPARYELPVVADEIDLPENLKHFRGKLEFFQEALFWQEEKPGELAKLIVFITWKMPNEASTQKPHVYRHVKFVSRKELSLFARPKLEGYDQ